MKKTLTTAFCILALYGQAFATWSIIYIDPNTGEIGMAGASCTADVSGIGSIVPGNGAIIVQAMSNFNAHDMGRKAIIAGHPIEGIMDALRESRFDPEHQQYALVTLTQMNPLTYTGDSTFTYKGALTARGLSVQGNILSSDTELQAIFDAAMQAQKDSLDIHELLIRALEAGSKAGGDRRCGEQRAQSAFVKVAKPEDSPETLYLNLVVTGVPLGGDNADAVLRDK
jgi:uncharacterized Ntn-hydrolase superfamily protein